MVAIRFILKLFHSSVFMLRSYYCVCISTSYCPPLIDPTGCEMNDLPKKVQCQSKKRNKAASEPVEKHITSKPSRNNPWRANRIAKDEALKPSTAHTLEPNIFGQIS